MVGSPGGVVGGAVCGSGIVDFSDSLSDPSIGFDRSTGIAGVSGRVTGGTGPTSGGNAGPIGKVAGGFASEPFAGSSVLTLFPLLGVCKLKSGVTGGTDWTGSADFADGAGCATSVGGGAVGNVGVGATYGFGAGSSGAGATGETSGGFGAGGMPGKSLVGKPGSDGVRGPAAGGSMVGGGTTGNCDLTGTGNAAGTTPDGAGDACGAGADDDRDHTAGSSFVSAAAYRAAPMAPLATTATAATRHHRLFIVFIGPSPQQKPLASSQVSPAQPVYLN